MHRSKPPRHLLGSNGTDSPDDSSSSVPAGGISGWLLACVLAAVVLAAVIAACLCLVACRRLRRRKAREVQLASITPKSPNPWLAGVRASQPIEFVVPSTVLVGGTAHSEDSVSETDGSSKNLPILVEGGGRRRKRSSGPIRPDELQQQLYAGVAASAAGGAASRLGRVGFSLKYDLCSHRLGVRLIGAEALPCRRLRTTANPCAKVALLPDHRGPKFVTKVQRDTSRPRWDESFAFDVRWDELPRKRLKISVWDYDRFSRKCLVGQVVYRLRDSGLTSALSVDTEPEEIWMPLRRDSLVESGFEGGEILLSLCYDPDSATLTLEVDKVRSLSARPDKDTSLYVKVRLYARRKLLRTKKTPSRRKAAETHFGTAFSIHVPQSALQDVDLLVVVCERGTLGCKQVVGRTQAGANCLCDQGRQHWQDMLGCPKTGCAMWHMLCS